MTDHVRAATPSVGVRTVLVTGAARGIGRATAEALTASGWRVVAGVRTLDDLVPFSTGDVHTVALDVTDPSSVKAGVAAAEDLAGGALGGVVCNAGWALFGAVEDLDLAVAREEFETNVFGAVAVIQAALPAMRRARRGVVVGVSTLSGRIPLPLFGMYSASKVALGALCEALALEVSPDGLRVLLVEAGVVRTEFARSTRISGSAGDVDSSYGPTRDRVLGRLRAIREEAGLEAEDVARAISSALDDDEAPFRITVPDEGLRPLLEALDVGAERHSQVRTFFGLDPTQVS